MTSPIREAPSETRSRLIAALLVVLLNIAKDEK